MAPLAFDAAAWDALDAEIRQVFAADRLITPDQVRGRVEEKVADVERKIAELERIRGALTQMAGACEVHGPLGDCPFLDALEAQPGTAA